MANHAPIDGIVLAAGRSSRMGRPKALLRADEGTFLARAIRLLLGGGCRTVIAVVAAADEAAADEALRAGAVVARNPDPDAEPIASVRVGIQTAADAGAVVILPVDYPLIGTRTVSALVHAWRSTGTPIVLPQYEGVTGHPILIDRLLFDEILTADLPEGLHSLIRAHADDVHPVRVPDASIHADIDTPEEYARHFPADSGDRDGT
jgi:CTP:molybdopterin cytidylyltransferase MocA